MAGDDYFNPSRNRIPPPLEAGDGAPSPPAGSVKLSGGWDIVVDDKEIRFFRNGNQVESVKIGEKLPIMLAKIVRLLTEYDLAFNPSGAGLEKVFENGS